MAPKQQKQVVQISSDDQTDDVGKTKMPRMLGLLRQNYREKDLSPELMTRDNDSSTEEVRETR